MAAVALSFFALARAARAQELPPAKVEPYKLRYEHERQLGPHIFPVPTFFPSAFITTHFSLRQGLARFAVNSFPVTQNRRQDVGMIGVTESLEFGLAFLKNRLEVFGVAGAQGLTGDSRESMLTLGTNYSYSLGGGVGVKLFRLEDSNTQVSLRARAVYDSGGSVQLLRLIDAINVRNQTLEELFGSDVRRVIIEDTSRIDSTVYLLAAQSIGKNFGAQAGLGFSRSRLQVTAYDLDEQEDVETVKTNWEPEGGLIVDANLLPIVPFGASLEWVARSSQRDVVSGSENANRIAQVFGFSLHTVNPHFQVSLTGAQAINLQPVVREINGESFESETPAISYGQISVHTFW